MAMLSKITRVTGSACSPLCFKTKPILFRYDSSSSGDDKKSKADNPNEPTWYDVRKYGHQLPKNDVCPPFEIVKGIPSGIFRCTDGEILGLGAGKNCIYQVPEYFSYHHMSFFDISMQLNSKRVPQPDTKRKPP